MRYDRSTTVRELRSVILWLALLCAVLMATNLLLVFRLREMGHRPEIGAATMAGTAMGRTGGVPTDGRDPSAPAGPLNDSISGDSIPEDKPGQKRAERAERAERRALGLYRVTAYCSCGKCCGRWAENRPGGVVYTASGAVATPGRTIAVDPSVIPYGATVYINGHAYVAEDCGGGIDGACIDLYMGSHEEAVAWGLQYLEVYR